MCNNVKQQAADHPYFNFLREQPEAVADNSGRTDAELDRDCPEVNRPYYTLDRRADATLVSHTEEGGNPGSLYCTFPVIETRALFVWECRWPEEWIEARDNVNTHKCFMVHSGGNGDERRLETTILYSKADPGYLAKLSIRLYHWIYFDELGAVQDIIGSQRFLEPFQLKPDTWITFWQDVDFELGTFSMWAADGTMAEPVQLLHDFPIDYEADPIHGRAGECSAWRTQYNTSQTPTPPSVPVGWWRNAVILKNVEDPQRLVDAWSDAAPPVEPPVEPPPIEPPPEPFEAFLLGTDGEQYILSIRPYNPDEHDEPDDE